MKNKTLSRKDILEIEDWQIDAKTIIIENIKKYKFVTREMLIKNTRISKPVLDNAIRQLKDQEVIIAERKLIKYKKQTEYKPIICYSFSK